MHCASLANLKRCEVEAERLNLPLELQQFAVGRALQAIGGECFAKLLQLTHKVTRICVRPFAPLLLTVDAELSCAPETFSNCAKPAPIRLVREAIPQDALSVTEITCVALERYRERSWDRIFWNRCGNRERQALRNSSKGSQCVVCLNARRLSRRYSCDVRVPVTVAADPAPPSDGRHLMRRP
jgi:hypothetical protein